MSWGSVWRQKLARVVNAYFTPLRIWRMALPFLKA